MMVDRIQAAIAAIRDGLNELDRDALLRHAANDCGLDPYYWHARRVVAVCGDATEASVPPAAPIGMGANSVAHPVHAPRTALLGMILGLEASPKTEKTVTLLAGLRGCVQGLDGVIAGRA